MLRLRAVLVLVLVVVLPAGAGAGGKAQIKAEKRARNQLEMRNPIPKDRLTRKVLREQRQLGEEVEPGVRIGVRSVVRGYVWQDRGRKKDRRAHAQMRQRLRIAKLAPADRAAAAEFFAEANRLGLALVNSTARTTPRGTRLLVLEYMSPIEDPRWKPEHGLRIHEITLGVSPGGENAWLSIARDER